jgi:hypothetical protein
VTMLLEQSSSQAGGGTRTVRRLLAWPSDVSAARRVTAWVSLAVTVVIAVLLLLGG